MSLVREESGDTENEMDTIDNNNVDETATVVAKRLVQPPCRSGEKIAEFSQDFDLVARERNSLDDILETVAHCDDEDESEAVPPSFLVNDDVNKNGDVLSDVAHDSGVESPLENSIGTDSDCEKKDENVELLDVGPEEIRTSSESGAENLTDVRMSVSDDEDSKEDCVMMGVAGDQDTVTGPEVEEIVSGDGLPRPLLVNGDSLELDVLPENISVIEDSHDSCGDSRPASRRRKSTPKKRTYTPTAYDDSASDTDSYADLDLDEAMEEADEMHIINAMESVDSVEDDSALNDLDLSQEQTDLSRSTEDVSVALLMQDNLTQEASQVRVRGLPTKGLKKAEHKCPFCNFAYTSVNYVLSHLYRAHNDVEPVILNNAIAQVTTWYKASATAKLLEQQAEGTLLNPDDAAISALTGQALDCVDGPLISTQESFNQFPESQTVLNGVAVMNNVATNDKDSNDSFQTHSRRTLMTQSYPCDKCNAKFKMHSQLETHMKRHRSVTPLPCNLCGMVFFSAENLQQHKRTHLKDSITCDLCNAQFQDDAAFLEHQKTHNLKHDCVHCGRQYGDAQTLTNHLKDHINEGPIRCEKCDLWFADKSTLGQHLQIHGSDQLYQCQFCAYTFTEMAVLRRHTESHLKLEIIELLLNGENSTKKLPKSKSSDVDITPEMTKRTEANKENDENLPKDGVQYTCCLCPLTFSTVSVLLDHVYKTHSVLNDNVRAMQQLLGLATASMPLPMTPDMMNAALFAQSAPVFNLANLYPQMLLNKPVVFGNPMDQSKQNFQNLNFVQNPGVLLNLQSPNSTMTAQPLTATKDQKSTPNSQKTISEILKPQEQLTSKAQPTTKSLLLTSPPPPVLQTSTGLQVVAHSDSLKSSANKAQQQNGHYIDIKVPSFKANQATNQTQEELSPSSQKSLLSNHLLLPAKRIKMEEPSSPSEKTPKKGSFDQVDGMSPDPKGSSPSLRAPLLSSMIAKADSAQATVTPRHFGFESDVEKPFSCGECGKRFKRNCHLQLHMRTHTDDLRAYRCSQCGMKFIQLRSLEMHLKTHSIEKPYNCQFCGKSFAQKYNLKLHIRTHTGEKPYGCAYCEMRFADPGSLNRHTRTHTGEKPYKCEHCQKKFAQKYNLHLHLRIHTHERPFRCVYCDKRFVQKNNLLLHLKVHAEIAVQNGVAPTPLDSSGNQMQIPDQDSDAGNLVIDMASITDQTTIPDAALQKQVVESHMQAENQLNQLNADNAMLAAAGQNSISSMTLMNLSKIGAV